MTKIPPKVSTKTEANVYKKQGQRPLLLSD